MPIARHVAVLFSKLPFFQLEPITALGVVTLLVGVPAVAYCWWHHTGV